MDDSRFEELKNKIIAKKFKKVLPSAQAAYNCVDVDNFFDTMIKKLEEFYKALVNETNNSAKYKAIIDQKDISIKTLENQIAELKKEIEDYKKSGYTKHRNDIGND